MCKGVMTFGGNRHSQLCSGAVIKRSYYRSQTHDLGFSAQKAAEEVAAAAAHKLAVEVASKSQGKHRFHFAQNTIHKKLRKKICTRIIQTSRLLIELIPKTYIT